MSADIEVEVISPEIMDFIDRRAAKEAGMTLEAYRESIVNWNKQHWCKCGNKLGQTVYHADGIIVNDHCVHKHHYHCLNCHKLVQIG